MKGGILEAYDEKTGRRNLVAEPWGLDRAFYDLLRGIP